MSEKFSRGMRNIQTINLSKINIASQLKGTPCFIKSNNVSIMRNPKI